MKWADAPNLHASVFFLLNGSQSVPWDYNISNEMY